MKDIKKLVIGVILLFVIMSGGAFLYFYKLDSIPSGFYIDEALVGYNAYSILQTGKDEYGKTFPLLLRFYGSYNPPLYTYFTVPSIALFGLSVTSVRLMAALSGFFSILVLFFFLRVLNFSKSKATPFVGALLFAISPWVVFYSRVGYEISLGFLIFSLGALLIWIGLKRPIFFMLGLAVFSLATYAAYTERLLLPILIPALYFTFRKELFSQTGTKYLFWGLFVIFLVQFPYLSLIGTPAFFPKSDLFYSDDIIAQAEKIFSFLPHFIAISLSLIREFISHYFSYFSPRSLFFLPDPDLQRSIPELSVFYSWMLIPFIAGSYYLWQERGKSWARFVLMLTILSPIPASLTGDPFSTHRAFPILLPLMTIMALGIDRLIYQQSRKPRVLPVDECFTARTLCSERSANSFAVKLAEKIPRLSSVELHKIKAMFWVPLFLFLIAISLVLLWRSYFIFLPYERAKVWGYGFEQLSEEIKKRPDEKFLIDQARIKPAYIELAFFLGFPPSEFQKTVDQSVKENYYDNTSFNPNYKFANIETGSINWKEDIYEEQILVGDELAISAQQAKEHFLTKIFEIRSPMDEIVFRGFRTNPKEKCARTLRESIYCK